jgi:hypothetical protein
VQPGQSKSALAYKYSAKTSGNRLSNFVYAKSAFYPITTHRTLEIGLNMPNLRPSTLKQRAYSTTTTKAENARIQKHTVRRKPVKSTCSSPSINHALGAMSRLPFEVRQAIFKQFVPAETPPSVPSDNPDIDEVASVENDATSSTRGSLLALLCTSKAISTEVKYTASSSKVSAASCPLHATL